MVGIGMEWKPWSYRVHVPSRDISDVFEQVMPRHNTLHVNMLLMPQRHDLLVQLLYPTYVHTHTQRHTKAINYYCDSQPENYSTSIKRFPVTLFA